MSFEPREFLRHACLESHSAPHEVKQMAIWMVVFMTIVGCESASETAPCCFLGQPSLVVRPSNAVLAPGDTFRLIVEWPGAQLRADDITWTSSDTLVAAVSLVGTVTARRVGTITIVAVEKANPAHVGAAAITVR